MGTTLSVTFLLGRYHATHWDGGANTSDVEWPPSPWRILRALVATWYARWPDLPAADLDRILGILGTPDAYLTPPTLPGSTRHYMPDLKHARAETGNTDEVIDAFLAIAPDEPLRIHWSATLVDEDRETLAKLSELMPYLGRSESICSARLDDDDPIPDSTWWRLGETGPGVRQVSLLAPDGPVQRHYLETTTIATRRARRMIPEGARKISYGTSAPRTVSASRRWSREHRAIDCLRFELASAVPLRARNAVLAADAMHDIIAKKLKGRFDPAATAAFVGLDLDGGRRRAAHDHIHICPLPSSGVSATLPAGTVIDTLYVWRTENIPADFAGAIQREVRKLWTRNHLERDMADQIVLTAGAGRIEELLPELCGPATEWISVTPYLPVRHRKPPQDAARYLESDIAFECGYRNLAAPIATDLVDSSAHRREISQYRRRRTSDKLPGRRPGCYLRLHFVEPVSGPLALGQLSHFGYGLFMPVS
jgi:CRISPR-associated protein Csb2